MEITEVRVTLWDETRLKGFANVTFDNVFVVRGMKIIKGNSGLFVAMPSRKRSNGTYQDSAHPVNRDMRRMLEEKILEAYDVELLEHSRVL
jgi:stage V sporulation protein G